jgi:DNA polymerase-4
VGTPRTILHVDLDAFFASVEQLDDPALRARPVLVGGTGNRGVVAAASYEARAFGCRSAMPMATARRLCPHAVVVRGRHERYRELSTQVFTVLERFTPLVQPVSIDEAFLDCTGSLPLFGPGCVIGERIRAEVRAQTGLTCSVGVAPNKFLSKLASDLRKPDALVELTPEGFQAVLDPLPVSKIWGVGPAAEASLARLGVRTIADLRAMPPEVLRERFGDFGAHIHDLAHGVDERPVHTDRQAKSISHEQTFAQNLSDPDDVRAVLADQAEQTARRLRRAARFAQSVSVKIRFGDFETITRATSIDATDRTDVIVAAARGVFDAWAARSFRPVRLIGCALADLTDAGAPDGLFDRADAEKRRAVDAAADAIAARFGKRAVVRASTLRTERGTSGAQPDAGQWGPGSQADATPS